jgi:threonine dehydratase
MTDIELVTGADVADAAATIAGRVIRTPTLPSPGLSAYFGVATVMKAELFQHSGSFKPRGVYNKLLRMAAEQCAAGVVAVSGGNHALAVAEATRALGVPALVVMPETAPAQSIDRCRAAGAEVRLTPSMPAAFTLVDELVAAGRTPIHPFDDREVVAAQGTVGLELIEDAPDITDVIVSIGGGGLISGVAAAVRDRSPDVRVWGVETEGADAMRQALDAGAPVPVSPSSIVTTLCAPHVSLLTLAHVSEFVEDVLVVSDRAAVAGSLTLAEEAKVWAEPAAGCLVPAARTVLERVGPGARLALVICGGNMTADSAFQWTQTLT